MFQQKDYFDDGITAVTSGQNVAGRIGAALLHAIKLLVLGYTGWHGIHAASAYSGPGIGAITGAAGIVVTELSLLGLYLAFVGHYVGGGVQRWIAFAVYALGLATVILTSIADSFLNASLPLPVFLQNYLHFGLPVSPIAMLLGAFLVHYFHADSVRGRAEAGLREGLAEVRFKAWLASQAADLENRKIVANAMLNAKAAAAVELSAQFQSPGVQSAIKQAAHTALPSLLASIGVDTAAGSGPKTGQPAADFLPTAAPLQQHANGKAAGD